MKTITQPMANRGVGADATDLRDMAYEYRRRSGNYLRGIREEAGMTQKDVALAMGLVPTAVSGWETGRIPLPPDRYAQFAELFSIDTEQFGKVMLRFTNPWVFALVCPRDPAAKEVIEELSSLPERYIPRVSPSKRKVNDDEAKGPSRNRRR